MRATFAESRRTASGTGSTATTRARAIFAASTRVAAGIGADVGEEITRAQHVEREGHFREFVQPDVHVARDARLAAARPQPRVAREGHDPGSRARAQLPEERVEQAANGPTPPDRVREHEAPDRPGFADHAFPKLPHAG
ncbi:MAG: hypothetical protein N2038_14430 [Geminicoccaceae bacterium]|nr:hypothetical protein [Geminicoccaceae bacterium]